MPYYRYCRRQVDYPNRAQIPGGVVHAAIARQIPSRETTIYIHGERSKVKCERHIEISTACRKNNGTMGWATGKFEPNNLVEVDKDTPITCKNCLKSMGDEDHVPVINKFVIREKETGYFRGTSGKFVKDLTAAKLFQLERVALKQISTSEYYTNSGRRVEDKEYWSLKWSERKKLTEKLIPDPKLEVRQVEMRLT